MQRQRLLLAMIVCGCCAVLIGCSPSNGNTAQTAQQPLADSLRVYGWADDIDPTVFQDFTAETGVLVTYDSYPDQETAIQALQNGAEYDLLVISNELLPSVIDAGLAATLDKSLLSNFGNLDAIFRNLPYDPDNTYSVPYNWGTYGLLINDQSSAANFTSWADLWSLPENDSVVSFPLLRYVIGFALKSLGYSVNTEDPAQLESARQRLLELTGRLDFATADDASLTPYVVGGGYPVTTASSREALEAQGASIPTHYVLPSEGGILWGDNFMIPSTSQNVYTAHVLLNYLLRAQTGVRLVSYNLYATPNRESRTLLPDELRNNTVLFPDPTTIDAGELILALSPDGYRQYQVIWEEILAANAAS